MSGGASVPDVSVIIVTYNSAPYIAACIESLREHTRGVSFEIIVVDNRSSDLSAAIVEADYPWVRLLLRRKNAGLATGVNDGVRASNGRYVMALNPDCRIDHDALTPLVAYLDANPDAGVVAPKLLDDDGTLQLSCRRFPGYTTALFSRYSLLTRALPGNRFSADYLMSDFDHASTREVDWVSGAAMMFPRAAFERVGGWDAGFFMFNEDVDFCRRMHDAGRRVMYDPEVSVYHRIGVSKSAPPKIIVARHRSMWRYYRKHLRGNPARDAVTGVSIAARCAFVLGTSAVSASARQQSAVKSQSSEDEPLTADALTH